jgi:hypothetical protein
MILVEGEFKYEKKNVWKNKTPNKITKINSEG